jgi:hypothetical protein
MEELHAEQLLRQLKCGLLVERSIESHAGTAQGNFGGRFSTNAVRPSTAASVLHAVAITADPLDK